MKSIALLGTFLLPLMIADPGQTAGISKIRKISEWEGVWQGSQGSIMTVREQDSVLDISGKDTASIYTTTCLIDSKKKTQATCLGQGINHDSNTRFLYESSLTFNNDGSISETWNARFIGGKLQGEAVFKKR